MTTGHKLLLKLTNGQRKKFILNITKMHGAIKAKNILDRKYQNIGRILFGSFNWHDSSEGVEYWTNVYKNAI